MSARANRHRQRSSAPQRRTLVALALIAAVVLAGCSQDGGAPAKQRTRTITVDVGPGANAEGDRGGSRQPAGRRPPQVPGVDKCDGARDRTTEENLRAAEMSIRCLTNAARSEHGLRRLRFDEQLARAAATRSNDMARLDYFAHNGPEGGNVTRAAKRSGYVPKRRSYLLGENIGWAQEARATPAQLMRSWLDSPRHRANILSKDFREMGVGAIAGTPKKGAGAGATYTQIFGVTGRAAREAQTG